MCRGARFVHHNQSIIYYDQTGISSLWTKEQQKENDEMLDKHIPAQLKPDIAKLEELRLLQKHRSTRWILNSGLGLARRLYKKLIKIEAIHSK